MTAGSYRMAKAVPPLVLAGLFLVTAVLLVSFTGAYHNKTADETARNQSVRIAQSYLANQMRQADGLEAGRFDGSPSLACFEPGGDYATLLYLYDGWLYELYAGVDAGLGREDGTALIPLSRFEAKETEPGLFHVEIVDAYGQFAEITQHKEVSP